MICPRCYEETRVTTMSWFNEQEICLPCQEDEKFCPNYNMARSSELSHVRSGNMRFAGISLSPADFAVLRERREARKKK